MNNNRLVLCLFSGYVEEAEVSPAEGAGTCQTGAESTRCHRETLHFHSRGNRTRLSLHRVSGMIRKDSYADAENRDQSSKA